MKIKSLPINPHKQDWIEFTGGLDITSPQITIPPGYCRLSQNFEEDILGGYTTLTGYERYSGNPNFPSAAEFYFLNYTGSRSGLTVGSTITGATTGSTGVIIGLTSIQIILTAITGTWNAPGGSESLVGLSAVAVEPIGSGQAVDDITSQYLYLASEYYRNLIYKVGETSGISANCKGPVLGVWYYNGNVYAFRNLNASSGVGMFVSSSSGWQSVNMGYEVYFSGGSGTPPTDGTGNTAKTVIAQGTVSATLQRLIIESGTFAAGNAKGRLIFTSITGGPFTGIAFTSGITANCVVNSYNVSGAISKTYSGQNGRFSFITDNFYGLSTSNMMYGADGVNRGFEFDGTVFVPINTGMGWTPINTGMAIGSDSPLHVTVHQGFLFYSFFGSVQFSATGTPYNWQPINGAVEIGVGDTVTGFVRQPGNESSPALAIYCRNHTYMLYGNTATTWNLVNYNDSAGAIAYSAQKIGGHTFVFDDRGVTNLQTSLVYGNFQEATISQRVKTLLAQKRYTFTDSHIMRDKQQYRLFFNDGSGMYITLGSDINSFMPVLFPDVVNCSVSLEFNSGLVTAGGADVVFFGSDSGYVMQMEKGTSFDGQEISSFMDLVFNNNKSYRQLKRYRRITFEMIGYGYSQFNTSYDLNYASTDYGQPDYTTQELSLSSGNWDSGISWDSNVTWDGSPLTSSSMAIDGDGMNIAVKLSVSSSTYASVKFSGVLIEYSPSRMQR